MNLNKQNPNKPKISPYVLEIYNNYLIHIEKYYKIKFSNYVRLQNIKFFETMFLYEWEIAGINKYLEYNQYSMQFNFDKKYLKKYIWENIKDIKTWNILMWFYINHNSHMKETKRVVFANKNSKTKTALKTIKERMEDILNLGKVLN